MTGEVIKQFLVSLGFGVDEKGMAKFSKAIDNAYVRVGLLAGGIKAAAIGIFAGISKISESFEEMGYQYRIIAPAINKAIILRRALLAAYKDAGINMVQAVQASVKFNLSLEKSKYQWEGIFKSVAMKFIPTLTKQMDSFRAKVSANMPKILAFLERIIRFIFKASDAVTRLGVRLWSMFSRVWDFLVKLDQATDGWSTKILAMVAAWKLLNLAFLTSPIGMIITGILALLALYDDFMTWREGGESLFDWGSDAVKTVTAIVAAVAGMVAIFFAAKAAITAWGFATQAASAIMTVLSNVMKVVRIGILLFNAAMALNPVGAIILAVTALIGLLVLLYTKWDVIKKSFTEFFSSFGGKALAALGDFFGGENKMNVENTTAAPTTAPLGSTTNNSSSNNIKQETNIIVQGGNNPEATARAVSGEQNRVNFDMARNMKGAAR